MKNILAKSLPGLMRNCMACSEFKEINQKIKAPF